MAERRYRFDAAARRHGHLVIGGSPLKLFRLTAAGAGVADDIGSGRPIPDSALIRALVDAGAVHPVTGSDTAGDTAVTIVVPSLGPPGRLPEGALLVDDGSQPPLTGAAVRLERTSGPGAARNAGLARVTTPLVAFVDADVYTPEGWLDALLPHFDDERVAVVAPRVRSEPGPAALARYEADHSPLDLGAEPARVRAGTRVSYVPAAAIVCRTDVVRAIGGFDDGLRFGEDVDLVWRLDRAGWHVRYEPASVVTHAPRATWPEWFRQRVGYGSSVAPLARRHPGALAPIRMNGWSVAAWVVGVAAHPVAGVAIGVGSAAALVRKLGDVPPRVAFGLAWRGNLHAGEQIAAAIRRVWWPLLLVGALRSRRARRVLVAAVLARRHPVGVVDDVAYSIGLWRSMFDERTLTPLVPEISSWPPRGAPSPPGNGG